MGKGVIQAGKERRRGEFQLAAAVAVLEGLQGRGSVQCFSQPVQELQFQRDLTDGSWCSPKEPLCLQCHFCPVGAGVRSKGIAAAGWNEVCVAQPLLPSRLWGTDRVPVVQGAKGCPGNAVWARCGSRRSSGAVSMP